MSGVDPDSLDAIGRAVVSGCDEPDECTCPSDVPCCERPSWARRWLVRCPRWKPGKWIVETDKAETIWAAENGWIVEEVIRRPEIVEGSKWVDMPPFERIRSALRYYVLAPGGASDQALLALAEVDKLDPPPPEPNYQEHTDDPPF